MAEKNPPSYDHIVLTPEETAEALRIARKSKAAILQKAAYWEKVMAPEVFPTLTAEELQASICGQMEMDHYVIDSFNESIIWLLSLYFSGDARFESFDYKGKRFSLQKGLMVSGPIGCGKTRLMEYFHQNPYQSYFIVRARETVEHYNSDEQGGDGAIRRYKVPFLTSYRQLYYGQTQLGFCFDDLGTEEQGYYFKKSKNVMEEILTSRYENLQVTGPMTHLTLNITPNEIEAKYSARLRDRMREMFNQIVFDPKSPSRRQ